MRGPPVVEPASVVLRVHEGTVGGEEALGGESWHRGAD